MNLEQTRSTAKAALDASWARCAHHHKLKRDAARPILRLQSSEVAPRHEALTDLIGGRHGIFGKLASVAADAGQCLVMTDKDGILVRLESKDADKSWNGIALVSVWDERVAGTNGVSMALSEGRSFAVRGSDHYFSQLRNFACTAVPLRDAENEIIGVVNLSSVDRGNPADTLFATQLLGAAASRLQHTLFEQTFKNAAIVSVAMPGRRELIKGAELVAVGENGVILGATSDAHVMSGMPSHAALKGERFDTVFGTDMPSLDMVPGRVLSVRRDQGPMLDLWMRDPVGGQSPWAGFRVAALPTFRICATPARSWLRFAIRRRRTLPTDCRS